MSGPSPTPTGVDPARSPSTTTLLVVDDSPVVRRLITEAFEGRTDYRVVGTAPDGRTALAQATAIRPDVMILDLNMPVLDGYATLEELAARRMGLRVVVYANVEPEDLASTRARVEAAGATLVAKPVGSPDVDAAIVQIRHDLLAALNAPASVPAPRAEARSAQARTPASTRRVANAVVIASSTGGPNALEAVLGPIRPLRVPIFIVQHIAGSFSGRLAEQLDQACDFPVMEATDGMHPEPGSVYLAPGGIHLTVERSDDGRGNVLRLRDLPPVNSCRPSADILFQSAARIYGGNQVGVVLTGIGQDGLDGCRTLSALGASIIVQDEESSVVWGMPGAVAKAGLADQVLPIDDIGPQLERLTSLGSSRAVWP